MASKKSEIFREALLEAEKELQIKARAAATFKHKGVRGSERASALATFLTKHVPINFAIGKGEIVDSRDGRSGEIDLFIYDAASAAPIQTSEEHRVIPAEALYMVIEVKSVLSQAELDKCFRAARMVRELRPFGTPFAASPTAGMVLDKGYRCPYHIFSFTSNLGEKDWAQKEFDRIKKAAMTACGDPDLVDRVIVLNRGLIRPQIAAATITDGTEGIFLEFYIHVINFLMRERRRRPPIDWNDYKKGLRWINLT